MTGYCPLCPMLILMGYVAGGLIIISIIWWLISHDGDKAKVKRSGKA